MKKIIYVSIVFLFMIIGFNMEVLDIKADTEYELYDSGTEFVHLNYTNPDALEIQLPRDGYIILCHDASSLTLGIDSKKEINGKKVYGSDNLTVSLSKGYHKVYLLDGAGGKFTLDDGARISYELFVKKAEVYSIEYDLAGGVNSSENPSEYQNGGPDVTLASPTKEGYVFQGWYSDPEYKKQIFEISGDRGRTIYLYAKWKGIEYKINYHLNGGENDYKNQGYYEYGIGTGPFMDPTRQKYIFDGWYTDESFLNPITKIGQQQEGDIDIYAKWEEIVVDFADDNVELMLGETKEINLEGKLPDGVEINWSLQDERVIRLIDEEGEISCHAVGKGSTTIVLCINKNTVLECTVSVVSPKFEMKKQDIIVGKSKKIKFQSKNMNYGDFLWKSKDKKIVKVNAEGIIEGITPGKTCVSAKHKKTGITCKCKIVVRKSDKEYITQIKRAAF